MARIYTNGVLAMQVVGSDVPATQYANPNGITIGSPDGGSVFNGKIDEVRIYKRALSDSEIAALAVSPSQVADFTATPVSGTSPLAVAFTSTSFGTITNLYWTFGDGGSSNTVSSSVNHTYVAAGTYTVTLVVKGPNGSSTNIQNSLITVTPPTPPQITSVTQSGSNLIMAGTGGPTGGGHSYYVASSTNVALPLSTWPLVLTNTFNPDGSFSSTLPMTSAEPKRFNRIRMP